MSDPHIGVLFDMRNPARPDRPYEALHHPMQIAEDAATLARHLRRALPTWASVPATAGRSSGPSA